MEYLSIVPEPLAGPLDYLVELPDVRVDGVLAGDALELGLQRSLLMLSVSPNTSGLKTQFLGKLLRPFRAPARHSLDRRS